MSGSADIQAALSQLRAHPPAARAVGSTPQFKDLPPFTVFSQTVNDFTANQKIDGNFFGLKLPLTLNYPGTQFEISLDGAKPITVQTGDELIGPFGRAEILSVSINPGAPSDGFTAGTETIGIVFYRRPDVFWIETADANSFPYSGRIQATPVGGAGQTYFAANAPTTIGQGVSSERARGVRAIVQSSNGLITGGYIRLWKFIGNASLGVWCLTPYQEQLNAGALFSISSEFPILVPGNEYYAEVQNATNVGGSGDFFAFLQFGYEP